MGATDYFPPAESDGGWRVPASADQARGLARMDLGALAPARAWNAEFGVPFSRMRDGVCWVRAG
jgi:hypothetical protein